MALASPKRLYWASLSLMFNRYIKYSIRSRFKNLSSNLTSCRWSQRMQLEGTVLQSHLDGKFLKQGVRAVIKPWASGISPNRFRAE